MTRKRVLWDRDGDSEAIGYDGSPPIRKGKVVLIKELYCTCSPPGCGGCQDVYDKYIIGDNNRFFFKEKDNDSR